jgi:acyl-CoA synthetase (AMP-forming)/AMP-acid ligase II
MAEQSQVIVIRASSLWSGGAEPKMYSNCDLVIEEGVVAASEDEYRGRADPEIDGGGWLVVPGLVNCHTGKSIEVVDAEIVGDEGRPLQHGQVGNIRLKGRGVINSYYDNPRATALAYRDGWF